MFLALQILFGALLTASIASFIIYLYEEWRISKAIAEHELMQAQAEDHKARAYRAQ